MGIASVALLHECVPIWTWVGHMPHMVTVTLISHVDATSWHPVGLVVCT